LAKIKIRNQLTEKGFKRTCAFLFPGNRCCSCSSPKSLTEYAERHQSWLKRAIIYRSVQRRRHSFTRQLQHSNYSQLLACGKRKHQLNRTCFESEPQLCVFAKTSLEFAV